MIYWRSREGLAPPLSAAYFISPFQGPQIELGQPIYRLPQPSNPIPVLQRIDSPNRDDWCKLVEHALQAIEKGSLQKVVLARETTLILSQAPDPFAITAALPSAGAALFCAKLSDTHSILGASPERILRRSQNAICTEALAATRKKGQSPECFFHSDKARREFQFVEDYCAETLKPYCEESVVFTPLQIHSTHTVDHLKTIGSALLSPTISERQALQALHPTPALCGTPKQAALDWICAHEPFHRKFYGGYIGWSTPDQSDWMVVIRCCELNGNIAKLYTGTGIVAGSDPADEWDELEAKLSLYKDIFLWKR